MIIGIVVLNYRDSLTTKKLCSMIKEYQLINHIVVVDNRSPDDSFEELLSLNEPKIDIIQSDKNGGYSYGNNIGAMYLINNYKADIIFIANPDVEFGEDYILKISNRIINDGYGASTGLMLNPNYENTIHSVKINSYVQDLVDCTLLIKRLLNNNKKLRIDHNSIIDTELLPGSLFGISAQAFLDAGGFDENVFLYCEERILGDRMSKKGYRMCIDSSTAFIHRHAVSINKSTNVSFRIKQIYKSRYYFNKEYRRCGKLQLALLRCLMFYGYHVRKALSNF